MAPQGSEADLSGGAAMPPAPLTTDIADGPKQTSISVVDAAAQLFQ